MATKELKCPICGLVLLTPKLCVSHLRLVHAKDPNFHMCGVSGCREVFRAFSAFNSHIYRHHRDAIGVASQDSSLDHSSGSAFRSITVVTTKLKLLVPYCLLKVPPLSLLVTKSVT